MPQVVLAGKMLAVRSPSKRESGLPRLEYRPLHTPTAMCDFILLDAAWFVMKRRDRGWSPLLGCGHDADDPPFVSPVMYVKLR